MKSLEDLRLDDFRLELKGRSLVPIMQGGMGVNISTAEMAQAVAARGGIGHVSDAMVPDLADRLFGTGFTLTIYDEQTRISRSNITTNVGTIGAFRKRRNY